MAITESTKKIDGRELVPQQLAALGRPTYDNVEDERRARKIGLAASLRVFGRLGYGEGVAGHITARDPEFTDHFWVNPFGKSFRHMKTSDLILVNHDGDVVYGTTVEAAAFWFITMDRSCQAQLLAEAAGTPKLIPHESALYTQQLTGYADAGWFQFQPLFQEICASDPELFE